jgi:hypothetical protein
MFGERDHLKPKIIAYLRSLAKASRNRARARVTLVTSSSVSPELSAVLLDAARWRSRAWESITTSFAIFSSFESAGSATISSICEE